jgi:hypothetical protein
VQHKIRRAKESCKGAWERPQRSKGGVYEASLERRRKTDRGVDFDVSLSLSSLHSIEQRRGCKRARAGCTRSASREGERKGDVLIFSLHSIDRSIAADFNTLLLLLTVFEFALMPRSLHSVCSCARGSSSNVSRAKAVSVFVMTTTSDSSLLCSFSSEFDSVYEHSWFTSKIWRMMRNLYDESNGCVSKRKKERKKEREGN